MSLYSPERRTALVLCGTGAHGAYHAGVLRALQEAGVKIDIVAGHGIGAAGAALAAIGGSSRVWEDNGIWRSPRVRSLYAWKRTAIVPPLMCAALALVLLMTIVAVALGWVLPLWWTVTMLALVVIVAGGTVLLVWRHASQGRRAAGRWWWRLFGAPVDAEAARALVTNAIWDLIRGAAPAPPPGRAALGRKYTEVLLESLGQPGFAELVMVATDLDARHDVVAALLREPYRADFLGPRPGRNRHAEAIDLAGVGRDYAVDVLAGALTPPLIADPALVTYASDSFWRGESHRLCDRPAAVNRLLEEVAAAGATQVIVVSAVASVPAPHMLRVPRMDPRSRLGEFQTTAEAAALRDALEMARLRFDSVYVINPAHNPVGPFDVNGAFDEASDRRQDLGELMSRAYEDAYHQFIEPVVGASGEQLAQPDPGSDDMRPREHADRLFGAQ
ncbi:MAG TPA: patatin-like phospholipase family protein [Vicinamibacterales bacterium]|nr:patatin-like phospholipase family protein [Vicinamibacterales bacterium]